MTGRQEDDQLQLFNQRLNAQLNLPILKEALTHPSYKAVDSTATDNQRLEILGDAIIDLLVIEWLYNHSDAKEGILTKSRARLVQNTTLAQKGKELQIESVLRHAPAYQVQEKDLADAVEALFGALYVTGGLTSCKSLLSHLFKADLKRILEREINEGSLWGRNEFNPKNLVQEFFQQHHLPNPIYQLEKKEGQDHDPIYWFLCQGTYQNQVLIGRGQDKTIKEAQKKAAYDLFLKLQKLKPSET
ncbi:MAG: ribonuclease III family protein [Candidatus Heimdallarchaeota archaeon]|nr:MAG: ribonuclease III family protein [Candidatus Heimdallarchaeota archaeon]